MNKLIKSIGVLIASTFLFLSVSTGVNAEKKILFSI